MTSISTLGQALDQIELIKKQQLQFSLLSTQLSSGKKTQVFSGLNTDGLLSQRSRADVVALETYTNNITNADRRIKLTTGAIKQFQDQARILYDAMVGLSQQSVHQLGDTISYDDPSTTTVETTQVGKTSSDTDADFTSLRDMAAKVYDFLVDIVNTRENDRYLFAGAHTLTKPIDNTGTFDAAISGLIKNWKAGTITTSSFISDLQDRDSSTNASAITDSIIGYSSTLSAGSAGKVHIRISEETELDYTTLGNDQGFRDVLVAAAWLKNGDLPPIADTYVPPNAYPGAPDVRGAPGATMDEMKENFFEVFRTKTGAVNRAIDRLDQSRFSLENTRARIAEVKNNYVQEKNVLQNTIAGVEDVDTNEVAVKLNSLQVQLQASLTITGKMQDFSLVNYLFR